MNKALGFGMVLLLLALPLWAECPSADLTRDCFVDLSDFAVLSSQWLNEDPDNEVQDLSLLASQWLTGIRLPADMILIRGGTFQMGNSIIREGDSDELPIHSVSLDPFAMGQHEITNVQYCAFLNSLFSSQFKVISGRIYAESDTDNRYPYYSMFHTSQIFLTDDSFSVRTKGGRDMSTDPVMDVSWYGAVAYCNWRSQQESREQCYDLSTWTCDFTKKGYRLPTEAEWEYSARGGLQGKRFPWGDTITHNNANYFSIDFYLYDISPTRQFHPTWNDGIEPYTSPVGSFFANNYGLYDMAGNVSEWCNDWYGEYSPNPQTNPTGPATGTGRVFRGGCWNSLADGCRASSRVGETQNVGYDTLGFRVVMKP